MDKKILIAILLLVCLSVVFFVVKSSSPVKDTTFDQANRTLIVNGDVKIKKAGGQAAWQAVDVSTVLEKGDIVETARGSTVDIVIGNNTEKSVKLKENSRVEFQGINPAQLNLSKGAVLVAIKKLEPKSSFVVKTPTAVCGARGTGWLTEATDAKTKVCVFESNVYIKALDADGRTKKGEYTTGEGTERVIMKDGPVSEPQALAESDLDDWRYWNKNIVFLRDGKILINDFNRKENFNNIGGVFGSWNIFYSDPNQSCKDALTDLERIGDEGYALKLTYDVDSQISAYNGFFTNLMGIDISDYKYLVFFIKGDKEAGFTTRINLELKNRAQTGKITLEGITDEWKRMVIPISRFTGINDFKHMKELVIVFNDIGVTKKEGVIYIDDIYFTNAEPVS